MILIKVTKNRPQIEASYLGLSSSNFRMQLKETLVQNCYNYKAINIIHFHLCICNKVCNFIIRSLNNDFYFVFLSQLLLLGGH